MNYLKIYNTLIYKNKYRLLKKESGYEIHHIIPKCVGGSDSNYNLVKLTYREHFIAHLLLTKIYPESKELLYSAWKFTYSSDGHNKCLNSRTHKIIKQKYIQSVTIFLDEVELRQYFKDPNVSIRQASLHFGCNWDTIKKNMGYYNIEYLWDGTYTPKFDKEEIEEMLNSNKYIPLKVLAKQNNITYWKLLHYIKEYKLEDLTPRYNVSREKMLIDYINSGCKEIRSSKLHAEFNMSPYTVKDIFKKHNIKYLSLEEEKEQQYNKTIERFISDLFNNIPEEYSLAGFDKLFILDMRTIKRRMKHLNIVYKFGYKHHKGEKYEQSVGKFIRRGIDEGIFRK